MNKYLFSAPFLGFLHFTRMSDIIPLAFKPFFVPRTPYEEFWNSEHGFVGRSIPFFFVLWDVAGIDRT